MMQYRKDKITRRASGQESGTGVEYPDFTRKQTPVNTNREEEIRAWARHALALNGFGDAA